MSEKNGARDINYNLFYYAYKELSRKRAISIGILEGIKTPENRPFFVLETRS